MPTGIGTAAAVSGILGGAGALGSIFGANKQANAANQASQIQAAAAAKAGENSMSAATQAGNYGTNAANAAGRGMSEATGNANDQLTQQLQAVLAANGPYTQAGQQALSQLQQLYGEGGAYSKPFDYSQVDVTKDPGYQFRMDQGNKAVQAGAAARGNVLSTRAQNEVSRFSQGLASQEFGAAATRDFSAYTDARNASTGVLTNIAGLGEQANVNSNTARTGTGAAISGNLIRSAGYTGDAGINASQYAGNALLTATQQAGDFATQGANARAAGIVGGANAWNSGIQNAGNAAFNAYGTYLKATKP